MKHLKRVDDLTNAQKIDYSTIDSISLPSREEKIGSAHLHQGRGIYEVILHAMTTQEWRESIDKIINITGERSAKVIMADWSLGGNSKPYFLPVALTPLEIENLSKFNPVRAIRPMPRVSFPRIRRNHITKAEPPSQGNILRSENVAEIGIFDGGVDTGIPHLGNWVTNIDLTKEAIEDPFIEHGTAVCGAALYGSYGNANGVQQPKLRIKCFRVFPVSARGALDLELYRVLKWIRETVENPEYRHITTYLLSFGPDIPVDDNEIDPFTMTLDELAYENDILFVVASGNRGVDHAPFNRIQPPSDIANGIGVGAYIIDNNGVVAPANYTCLGPGRPGCMVKPDISAFGGSVDNPFYVFVPFTGGELTEEQGTSFAAPIIANVAGNLIHRTSDIDLISPQTAKALVIHSGASADNWNRSQYGWGPLLLDADELMTCGPNQVTVLFNGSIDYTRWVRLRLPFPDDISGCRDVLFEWTIAYACAVSPATPDEYTFAGTDVIFRPHSEKYRFNNKETKHSPNINIINNIAQVTDLLNRGYTQSQHPISKPYKREQELREEGKWDTVVRGSVKLRLSSIQSPVLDIHAISRAEWENIGPGNLKYAAVISITARNDNTLYNKVRQQIPQLVPVRLRARARRRVR